MNSTALKQLYKNKQLRNRLLVVLGVILTYSFISHIPVPVPDTVRLQSFLLKLFQSNSLLGFANLFSGGTMSTFSIILMGLGPYINASIIIQLLTQVVPKFETLSKEGEQGRNKLNQYTRWLTVPLAMVQAIAMIIFIQQTSIRSAGVDLIGSPSLAQWFYMVMAITAGSIFLMWLGEIITDRGIGNGISILILAGIISRLPATIIQQISLAQGDSGKIVGLVAIALLSLALTFFLVMINEGQRNIPVSYARQTSSGGYGGVDTHLPIRIISAGVIPIIFALAFLSVPGFIGQLFTNAKTAWLASFARVLSSAFNPNNLVYAVVYFLLVVGFTYFYTSIIFKPTEIAENLQKQGGFIPGIRPGKETTSYLKRIITRLTLPGSIILGLVAVLPFILQQFFKSSSSLSIGGTGLLIVVAVVIETMKEIESKALMATYEKY